jgi:hypothetical protein
MPNTRVLIFSFSCFFLKKIKIYLFLLIKMFVYVFLIVAVIIFSTAEISNPALSNLISMEEIQGFQNLVFNQEKENGKDIENLDFVPKISKIS